MEETGAVDRAGARARRIGASACGLPCWQLSGYGRRGLFYIPGIDDRESILSALRRADCAALYKPCLLKDDLGAIVTEAGPWRKMTRVDRAGLADERIFEGAAALEQAEEYLSILLLWR